MKEGEEYEDYLVDKARELLKEKVSDTGEDVIESEKRGIQRPGIDRKGGKAPSNESETDIPFTWDPREVKHLARNRKQMDNDDLREFLEKDTDFQEELEELGEWKGFRRWEERFMVQNFGNMDQDEIAEELGRDSKEVELKLKMLGLKTGDNGS